MNIIEAIFWTAVFLVVYPYVVYPAILAVIGTIWRRPVYRSEWMPAVTILIPAYNEAECIAATVTNKLEQDYPKELLQIIVVSDCSNDATEEIVRGFAVQGVLLISRERREGKAAALNEAIRHARGDVVVFSDANSIFERDAVRRITENFSDPSVGYVTGSMKMRAEDGSASGQGSSAYMRYESFLRVLETRTGSIIGVNGGVDAIRRDLYTEIPPHLITDFVLPLQVLSRRYRVVYDARVIAHEIPNEDISSEFRMRVRVALRALQGMAYMCRLFNPLRYPLVAFSLASHKGLRYLTFIFLPIALVANVFLVYHGPYAPLLAVHLSAYAFAFLGLIRNLPSLLRRFTIVPTYFLMTNVAFALATYRFLRGESMAIWRPRAG